MTSKISRILAAVTAAAALFAGVAGVPSAWADESATAATAAAARSSSATITNDTFWKDTDGNTIYSQGGGIFDFTDPETGATKHYWYGVHFEEAEQYAADPTNPISTNTFKSVDVYSSDDLVNWTKEGEALSREQADAFSDEFGGRQAGWVCRMGVAYVKSLNTYAMLIQHEMPTDNTGNNFDKKVLIATADSPTGPFTADRRISMKDYNLGTTNTGDQSVFQDEDGTGYLVYSYGSGRGSMWVAQIGEKNGKVDLLNPTKVYQGKGREGNAMFKYKGKYYLAASDLFGWDASRIHYLVSDNVFGPYKPTNSTIIMDGSREDFGHITQTGFYYTVRGTEQETVIHAGDRWSDFAGNGLGYNQWNPLSFSSDGAPSFNSMSQWNLNATTGTWSVGAHNDYVLNGTFEADRVKLGTNGYNDKDGNNIPDLAGWTRTNPAAVYNDTDKAGRVGDYNLQFNSSEAYTAKIEQTIQPMNFAFPDGEYTLSVQYMTTKAIKEAELYAVSGGQTYQTSLAASTGGKWIEASVPVTVSGGKATVGISVDGNAGDLLRADDIALIPSSDTPAESTALQSLSIADQIIDLTANTLQITVPAGTTIDQSMVKAVTQDANATVAISVEGDAAAPVVKVTVTTASGQSKVYTVNVVFDAELLVNGGFESGKVEPWTFTARNDTTLGSIAVKNKDQHSGTYALGSWTKNVQDYEMAQTVSGLAAGWYELSGWAQGNNDKNDDVTMDLLSGDTVLGSSKIKLLGSSDGKNYEWSQSKTLVYFAGGDLTARLSVKADANAWASFDDFSLKAVAAPAVESIAIATAPTKTKYQVGDSLDLTGLVVNATYKDGQGADVVLSVDANSLEVTGFDSSAAAEAQTITVAYQGKIATFTVTVQAKSEGSSGEGSGDGNGSDNGGNGSGNGTTDDTATPGAKPAGSADGTTNNTADGASADTLGNTGSVITLAVLALAVLAAIGGLAFALRRKSSIR